MNQSWTNASVRKESRERLAQMREAGIKYVQVLGCNYAPDECEAYRSMKETKIEIEFATPLPLPGCDKHPCKCIWLAVQ